MSSHNGRPSYFTLEQTRQWRRLIISILCFRWQRQLNDSRYILLLRNDFELAHLLIEVVIERTVDCACMRLLHLILV